MATNKYESIKHLVGVNKSSWVKTEDEAMRIASYSIYENMYWNIANAFKLLERGTENKPVYVPKPKTIVETLHRYMANNLQIVIDPLFGSESQQQLGMQWLIDLMRRERFYSKFSAEKRFGIIRGDWIFHLLANDELPEGARISIHTVQPSQLFKITEPDNVDAVIGYDIANFFSDGNKSFVRRLTYMKLSGTSGPSPITVEEGIYEADEWGGPGMDREKAKLIKPTIAKKELPVEIDALPIYHIKNFEESGDGWGSSELRGFEDILAAVNQTATDEQLTLALEGLGVYVTDAGQPIDDNGQVVPWNLGPARVVEIATGSKFERVNSVSSITPMLDHLKMMDDYIDEATGQSDVVKGSVEVEAAESGVALGIRFGPMIALSQEKELTVTDVLINFLYDIRKWERAYEGTGVLEEVRFLPTYGEKIPPNKQQQFENVISMATTTPTPIIDTSTSRAMLRKIGYEIPADTEVIDNLLFEKEAAAKIEQDAMGVRLDNEIQDQQSGSIEDENVNVDA